MKRRAALSHLNQLDGHRTAQPSKDNESREAHVGPDEAAAAEVEEGHEHEGGDGYHCNEGDGVEQGSRELG